MSDTRITETWTWTDIGDCMHVMARDKGGRWVELRHAQAVLKQKDAELERLRGCVATANSMNAVTYESNKQEREQLSDCRRLLREACEAWDKGTKQYHWLRAASVSTDPAGVGENIRSYPELDGNWYNRARAALAPPPPADAQRSEEPHP